MCIRLYTISAFADEQIDRNGKPVWRSADVREIKVKVKVHTLDIAPLRCETPQQKRSGMARVLKRPINQSINQSFICIRPMVHIKEEKKK